MTALLRHINCRNYYYYINTVLRRAACFRLLNFLNPRPQVSDQIDASASRGQPSIAGVSQKLLISHDPSRAPIQAAIGVSNQGRAFEPFGCRIALIVLISLDVIL